MRAQHYVCVCVCTCVCACVGVRACTLIITNTIICQSLAYFLLSRLVSNRKVSKRSWTSFIK